MVLKKVLKSSVLFILFKIDFNLINTLILESNEFNVLMVIYFPAKCTISSKLVL